MDTPIKAYMSDKVVSINLKTSVMGAARLMVKHDIGRLPVIDRDKLVGIVTRSDTMRYYYDLLLNEETGRYVYRLLALKLIMSNPEVYGFHVHKEELYPPIPTYQVTVDTTIENMAEFASRYSINYKVLKVFNPWLRETTLTNNNGKTYYISIPRKGYRDFSPLDEVTAENKDL